MDDIELPTSADWILLGIEPDTSLRDAKRAYRRGAKQSHPDRGGSPERFRQVAGAWARISASLEWQAANGFASAASFEDELFDEEVVSDVDDLGRSAPTNVVTTPYLERVARKLGRALFLSGRFPEREWSTLVALASAACLALAVHSSVHPPQFSSVLDASILALVVGRIVALPTRLRR